MLSRRGGMLGVMSDPDPQADLGALFERVSQLLRDVLGDGILDEDVLARCRRELGDDHSTTLGLAHDLAANLRTLGDYQRARDLDEDTLSRRRRVLGDDALPTLSSAHNLA